MQVGRFSKQFYLYNDTIKPGRFFGLIGEIKERGEGDKREPRLDTRFRHKEEKC